MELKYLQIISMMVKISAYCPRCEKTSVIDYDFESEDQGSEESNLVPIPSGGDQSESGLKELSVSHDDHILIMDVDENGSVRKSTTVRKIESKAQLFLGSVINKVNELIAEKDQFTGLIVSETKFAKYFLNSFSAQLIHSISLSDNDVSFSSNKDAVVLEYENFVLHQQNNLSDFKHDQYDFLLVEISLLQELDVISVIKQYKKDKFVLGLFGKKEVLKEKPKYLQGILTELTNILGENLMLFTINNFTQLTSFMIEILEKF